MADAQATAAELERLTAALLEDLEQLKAGAEDTLWRGHLRALLKLILRTLALGDLSAADHGLRALEKTQFFVDEFLPRHPAPQHETAAWELASAWSWLEVTREAAGAVEAAVEPRQLKALTSGRAILDALHRNPGRFLRRGELQKELEQQGVTLTPQRIGQILSDLYNENLLLRVERRAQGASAVSFYALSERGMDYLQHCGETPTRAATYPKAAEASATASSADSSEIPSVPPGHERNVERVVADIEHTGQSRTNLDQLDSLPEQDADASSYPTPDSTASSTPDLLRPRPSSLSSVYVAPSTELERTLVELWQQTLGVAPIGTQDNFFELGGHSLFAIKLNDRLQRQLKVNLPITSLFECGTVQKLAARILQLTESGKGTSAASEEHEPALQYRKQNLHRQRSRRRSNDEDEDG